MNTIITEALPSQKHPQILYMFWDEDTLVNKQYMNDIKDICKNTCFDLIFFTARGKLDFYADRNRLLPAFNEVANYAHEHHVKVGLQLWRDFSKLTDDTAISLLVEQELELDINGHVDYIGVKKGDRNARCRKSSLFAAYILDKSAPGEYIPGSLEEITDHCKSFSNDANSVHVTIDLGPNYAKKTVYVLTSHMYQSPDLFTDYYENSFRDIIDYYSEVPFDGVGLDEFKSLNVMHCVEVFLQGAPFRQRIYGPGFAKHYEETYSQSLKECVFDMRWAPVGEPERRICAINRYFDVLKENVIKVENFVATEAKRRYGKNTFIGLHNTYHNKLSNDEIWHTGCMWWDLPREYGQTDEDICYPVRMGISCSHPQPIVYDMYYALTSPDRIYEKAIRDARYGVRVHYHAYHDTRPNRFDLQDSQALSNITKIERRIRMLNVLDLPRPQMDLLVVFGRPALTNWYPNTYLRNDFDINGGLFVMEKCDELWNAGVVCALVPSTKIDSGVLRIDNNGDINYNGHIFKQILFIGPEYSKKETLKFILDASKNHQVFIDGIVTRDFDGEDATERFQEISKNALVHDFDLKWLFDNGIKKNAINDGALLEDGTVIVSNLASALSETPTTFSITSNNYTFTGLYNGITALRCNSSGTIDKLACGGFHKIYRNGLPYIWADTPCDLIINGENITIISSDTENQIHFAL